MRNKNLLAAMGFAGLAVASSYASSMVVGDEDICITREYYTQSFSAMQHDIDGCCDNGGCTCNGACK